MADKTLAQLTAITSPADADLVAVHDVTAGLLKKMTWLAFIGKVGDSVSSIFLRISNNLSDLASASSARANLGLGTVATLAASAVYQVANNLSEVANAAAARANIGAAASNAPTITGGMTFSGAVAGNTQAVASTTLDVATAEYQTKAISTNTAFTLTGSVSGKWSAMILELTVSSAGQPTFTGARWAGGSAPTLPNGTHLIGLVYSGATWTAVLLAASIA